MGENQSERITKITLTFSIIAVILVLGIILLPVFTKPTWHEVATFSGSENEILSSFHITSDRWKIHWIAAPDTLSEHTKCYFYVRGDNPPLRNVLEFGVSTASDFDDSIFGFVRGTEYLTGSGTFNITVLSFETSWGITVEAYY